MFRITPIVRILLVEVRVAPDLCGGSGLENIKCRVTAQDIDSYKSARVILLRTGMTSGIYGLRLSLELSREH